MSLEYRIGDVFDRLADIPDQSIDLIVTSPPFLALRSYLPDDHPDKAKEIGSEPSPAEFIDTLLALSAEWGRVLAPHGSLCVELGDTYSGSGGAGGDYTNADGLRAGQPKFKQFKDAPQDEIAAGNHRIQRKGHRTGIRNMNNKQQGGGPGWPLAKSMTGVPFLYELGLSYGLNLLTGEPSPAGQWRVRNRICWARPNPPVGALGDKFRPATSYITVACKGSRRYFDLDAVRGPYSPNTNARTAQGVEQQERTAKTSPDGNRDTLADRNNDGAGAPPLDWHADDHPEDGDWLWKLPTQPYKGSHYATFPMALPEKLIRAMCPLKVCTDCGVPSTRIVETTNAVGHAVQRSAHRQSPDGAGDGRIGVADVSTAPSHAERVTLGWSDCGHNQWRTGVVLDPFAGSGTTIEAAQAVGRHAIGIDLDSRNADLAQERVGMFMTITP